MKLNKKISLFLEYRMLKLRLQTIKKNRLFLKKHDDSRWDKHRESNVQSYNLCLTQKRKLLYQWKKITKEKINDFPYLHKDEIMKYYSSPSKINDRNPFLEYYD